MLMLAANFNFDMLFSHSGSSVASFDSSASLGRNSRASCMDSSRLLAKTYLTYTFLPGSMLGIGF